MIESSFKQGRAWIELDFENLKHNVSVLYSMLPDNCELMPAVKANGYGHGAVLISKELNKLGVQAFCVAAVSEGIELRENGVTGVILVLGYTHPEQFACLTNYDLIQTVVDYDYAQQLNDYGQQIKVHLAVDTGMHRIGERCENVERIIEIFQMQHLSVCSVFTHLCADDSDKEEDIAYTKQQLEAFDRLINQLNERGLHPKTHVLSSYGLMNYPECGGEYARIGIALYGVLSSKEDTTRCTADLRPVLSIKTRVSSVRHLHKGESAGYGLAFTADEDMVIAALAIGYADGLPRSLSCGVGSVLLNGCEAPIIGRICMDQTVVNVSNIPAVIPGDVAVVIGSSNNKEITVCDVAEQADTITNEILSRLSQRLERIVL